jgi:hypothetical protein
MGNSADKPSQPFTRVQSWTMVADRRRHVPLPYIHSTLLFLVTALGLGLVPTLAPVRVAVLRAFACRTSLPPRTFSGPRDVIWTMSLNFDRWFDISLLSIRTSGCQARVVLFTDMDHQFDTHFVRVIAMTWTEIRRRTLPPGRLLTDLVRFQWILAFLNDAQEEIDRVFMLDAYDVFFHRDPFEVFNSTTQMSLIEEGWPLRVAGVNAMWMTACFSQRATPFMWDETICSGTIYGPTQLFVKFATLVLSTWATLNIYQCLWDQPIINFLFHSKEFERNGIPAESFPCHGPVLTLSNCPSSVKRVDGVLEGFNGKGRIPYVVHQWKQFSNFRDMYVDRCDMSEYMNETAAATGVPLNWTRPARR